MAEHIYISAAHANAFVSYFEPRGDHNLHRCATWAGQNTGHINEQPREHWISKFASSIGFRLDEALTVEFGDRLRQEGSFP